MYDILFDADRDLLDIRWRRSFAPAEVTAYADDLKARFVREGFRPGYLLRIDMSDSAVQSQDALFAFAAGFRDFPKARRIAIVTPSAIARMQVRRVMTQPYLQVFETAQPALAWLLEPEAVPA